MTNSKYKNKDGVELNFSGSDSTSVLVREVIEKAVKELDTCNFYNKTSMRFAIRNARNFLATNFDLTDD